MKAISRRVSRLERGRGDESIVLAWIREGRHFCDLSLDERKLYQKYKESLGGVADDVAAGELALLFFGKTEAEAFNFPLTRAVPPPTPEEHRRRVREIESYILSREGENDV